jgi:sugar lactone lactonase YvrE
MRLAFVGLVSVGLIAAACGGGDTNDQPAAAPAVAQQPASAAPTADDVNEGDVGEGAESDVATSDTMSPGLGVEPADAEPVPEAAPAPTGPTYEEVAVWGRDDGNTFTSPNGVAIDADGNVYVTEFNGDRVQQFTPDGVLITTWGGTGAEPGDLAAPIDVDIDAEGFIYISEAGNSRVQKFTPTGELVGSLGSHGQGPGEFFSALALDISPDQRVYVIDWGGNRVNVFTTDGEFLFSFGEQGSGDGQFEAAQGLGVAPNGDVYVTDTENIRIQRFTSEGEHVATFGTNGFDPGQFRRPARVFIDEFLYISDLVTSEVAQFALDGTFIANVETDGLRGAHGVAIGPDGRMYIADTGNGLVRVLELVEGGPSDG